MHAILLCSFCFFHYFYITKLLSVKQDDSSNLSSYVNISMIHLQDIMKSNIFSHFKISKQSKARCSLNIISNVYSSIILFHPNPRVRIEEKRIGKNKKSRHPKMYLSIMTHQINHDSYHKGQLSNAKL